MSLSSSQATRYVRVHLHAQNGTVDEIGHVLSYIRGRRILLGPLSTYAFAEPHRYRGLFDAVHSHTVLSDNLFSGSRTPATYTELREERTSLADLLSQLTWPVIAEIEMYRGCTRRRFCSFCNEPVKNPLVSFREPADILHEITLLYGAGIRHFRLGQQTCFFSYHNRDSAVIGGLLRSIRESCPELEVLHIDNADPLAVASRSGARIAKLVAEYCTEGNCAPMGIESFDPAVVAANSLTCTPDILKRAVATINNAGATTRVNGLPQLLPGLNLVYGLPGETRRTHFTNLVALTEHPRRGATVSPHERAGVRLHQRYQILVEIGYIGLYRSVMTYRRIPPWLISRLCRQPGCRASGAGGWAYPGCPGACAGRPPPRFFVASWTSKNGDGGRGRQHCTRSCRG